MLAIAQTAAALAAKDRVRFISLASVGAELTLPSYSLWHAKPYRSR